MIGNAELQRVLPLRQGIVEAHRRNDSTLTHHTKAAHESFMR